MSGDGFIRLYKFYGLESALRNLEQRRLKIATIDDINDPFEWSPYDIREAADRKHWRNWRRSAFAARGVICFSKTWHHPLMWSHYAENHKGLAIGFDVRRSVARKIQYRKTCKKIEDLKSFVENCSDRTLEAAIYTKFDAWAYEEEWRTTYSLDDKDHKTGLFFKEFDQDLIPREVIIGARSSTSSVEINSRFGDPKLEIRTARLAFKNFRIVEQKHPDYMK